jgi:hypothetical protein
MMDRQDASPDMRANRELSAVDARRLAIGLILQPFVTAAAAFLSFPFLLLTGTGEALGGGYPVDRADAAASVAFAVAVVAVPITMFGAFPLARWRMLRGRVSLLEALLFGLGFGNLPFVIGATLLGTYGRTGALRGLAAASLLGLTGAAVLWMIAMRSPQPRVHPG